MTGRKAQDSQEKVYPQEECLRDSPPDFLNMSNISIGICRTVQRWLYILYYYFRSYAAFRLT